MAGLLFCCHTTFGQGNENGTKNSKNLQLTISTISTSPHLETVYVDFKLLKDGEKIFRPALLHNNPADRFTVTEDGKESVLKVQGIRDIRKMSTRMRNKSIYLLMDRSAAIPGDVLAGQRRVVEKIIETFDSADIHLAFMENGFITEIGSRITSDAMTYKNEFTADECKGEKLLFTSVMSKIKELSAQDSTGEKYLFVFTDGEIYDKKQNIFIGGDEEHTQSRDEYYNWSDSVESGIVENIPVFCFYMNPGNVALEPEIRNRLTALSSPEGKDGRGGRFFEVLDIDSLSMLMMRTLDSIAPDYQLVLLNKIGRCYDGTKITLGIEIESLDGKNVYGEGCYARGSKQIPKYVESETDSSLSGIAKVLIGLFWGIVVLGISYLIMQLAIPAISYKLFEKTYKKEFKAGEGVTRCYICKNPIETGQEVTTQCGHKMHWKCWDSMHGLCPQCTEGDHYYNKKEPWNARNAFASMKWILWGMGAGLVGWLFIRLFWSPDVFRGLIDSLSQILNHPSDYERLRVNLLGGIILGFFIVFGLSYALEYRRKNTQIVGIMILRALAGAMMGFIAFLIGSIILILAGQENNCWWLDWISWVLFSVAVAGVISLRTEVKFSRALIGGLIAVIISYYILYASETDTASMFSYMLYAAGLGGAIYAVHATAEKYFLRFVHGDTDKKIAIHKWMNVSGGENRVSVGADPRCTIQMNWDKSDNIADRAVEIFLEDKIPYLMVLADGVSRQGRTIKKETKLALRDGDEFSIGKTEFTYIENK